MSHIDLDQLERDLRAARTAFDDVPVSPDAWQRNQELVTAASSKDRRTFTAVAAGVVVLLVIAAGWLALGGRDTASDMPGSDGSGSSGSSGELVDPVQVAKIDLPSGTVTLEVGLEPHPEKADEPSLCDRLTETSSDSSSASGAGGCTSKVDRADLPEATVDYLTGGTGDMWTTLTGAVDRRTAKLTMWQADGTATDLELHDLVGSELRAFGVLNNGPALTRPVRLVAWADTAKRQVLESVDVVDRFDMSWLPGEKKDCASVDRVPQVQFPADGGRPQVVARGSFVDVEVTYRLTNDEAQTVCLPMDRPAAAVRLSDDWVAVALAPEVAPTESVEPVGTTMWRVGVWPAAEGTELTFADESGQVLGGVSP